MGAEATTIHTPGDACRADERELRKDLAALFRLTARLDLAEAVANHISAAVSPDGRSFLMNPKWRHFSRIRASDLLFLHADGALDAPPPHLDPTAWSIHGQLHASMPRARVVIHLHPPYATALASLQTPEILPHRAEHCPLLRSGRRGRRVFGNGRQCFGRDAPRARAR